MELLLDIWSWGGWDVLKNPAWLMAGLAVGIGLLGLTLLMLYPLGRD